MSLLGLFFGFKILDDFKKRSDQEAEWRQRERIKEELLDEMRRQDENRYPATYFGSYYPAQPINSLTDKKGE